MNTSDEAYHTAFQIIVNVFRKLMDTETEFISRAFWICQQQTCKPSYVSVNRNTLLNFYAAQRLKVLEESLLPTDQQIVFK